MVELPNVEPSTLFLERLHLQEAAARHMNKAHIKFYDFIFKIHFKTVEQEIVTGLKTNVCITLHLCLSYTEIIAPQ